MFDPVIIIIVFVRVLYKSTPFVRSRCSPWGRLRAMQLRLRMYRVQMMVHVVVALLVVIFALIVARIANCP